ncbi:hypothetical protein CHARACLAT_031817 [Characodon lateralis]|uniref:Uncharacterized protein n=1 Tax=Characodon lateralis TaxID=208331 RepID=A0ABU7F8B9_9TELE|nr:hypothetical protein [Characodon lateralis]
MFRGVWKLQPRRPSHEPPLCFQLQTQLLRSHLNVTINLPVHPPTLTLQPPWSFTEEKKHKRRNKAILLPKTAPPVSLKPAWKKDVFSRLAFPRTQPLEIPLLPACFCPGSSPTINCVS